MAFVSSDKIMSFSPRQIIASSCEMKYYKKYLIFFFPISNFNQENTEVHVGSTILRVF